MTPFQLQIRPIPGSTDLNCRWFGQSTIHAEGSLTLSRSTNSLAATISDSFVIDLRPLLAEIGAIADEQRFRQADEFLLLRELLTDAGFDELCEALYHFLWRETCTLKTSPTGELKSLSIGYYRNQEMEVTWERIWTDPDQRLVRVWFATNRKPLPEASGQLPERPPGFSTTESADQLSYGICEVFIPKSHKPGSTGTAWWRRLIRLEADDSLQLRGTYPVARDIFWAGLHQRLDQWWAPGERNLFVLIHGFNVGFDEAAIRAAQLGYDLKLPGEIAFYAWPSNGSLADYPADEATIGASVGHIAEFLQQLSEQSGAERIHLFVHSMGNRGFLGALERLAADHQPELRLGQVFFCAPDEDARIFRDKTGRFPHHSENRSLLVSAADRAVAASKWLHQHDRAGLIPPVNEFPGIETLAVEGFGILDLGHGYFAEAEPVILDIREAIDSRRHAADRALPRAVNGHYVIDIGG